MYVPESNNGCNAFCDRLERTGGKIIEDSHLLLSLGAPYEQQNDFYFVEQSEVYWNVSFINGVLRVQCDQHDC